MTDIVPTGGSSDGAPMISNERTRDALTEAERRVFERLNEIALQVKREHPKPLRGAALRSSVYKRIGNGDMFRGQNKVHRLIAELSITLDQIFERIERELSL
jgi:hypothetical protein